MTIPGQKERMLTCHETIKALENSVFVCSHCGRTIEFEERFIDATKNNVFCMVSECKCLTQRRTGCGE